MEVYQSSAKYLSHIVPHVLLDQEFGEILFGMSYLPTAERLSFTITKASGLKYQEIVEDLEKFSKRSLVFLICTLSFRVCVSHCSSLCPSPSVESKWSCGEEEENQRQGWNKRSW